MYMSLLGKPTDADLNTYPHEWDPSVLDYSHPTTPGDPTWAPDPSLLGAHDPRIDEFGNFKGRVQHTHLSHLAQHKHAITPQPIDFERLRPYFGWVNKHTIEKTFHKTTQWAVASTRYSKPTDADLNTYPHEWDPSVLDYSHPTTPGDPTWAPDPSLLGAHDPRIDEFGNFKGRVQHTLVSHQAQHKHAITPQPIDFERLRPYFGWVNKHTIEKTFHKTTQWAVASTRYPMMKHFKSRFPAFNIPRRSEEVATDTIFSDTPAIDSGVTMAQIFVGKRTLVTDVYPLKSQKQFVNTLEDNIRFRGAMTKLISDYAKVEISNKVKDILRMYHSSSWNSEPYHQNQNPAEGRYCTLKSWTNTIMNRSGAPADCWLLCMIHASYILNHLSCEALGDNVPLGMLYGVSPDISILLLYTFYQPVFYATHNQSFPSSSEERAARWVGFGEHVGDALTHKLLDDDTKKILYRSAVRPSDSAHPNRRLVSDGGECSQTPKPIVFVRSRQDNSQSATKPMAEYNPDDLIGRTFLLPKNEQGERLRATIKRKVIETSKLLDDQHDNAIDKINFHLDVGQGRAEAIMSYVQILDHLDQQEQQEDLYKFRAITGHHRPSRTSLTSR